LSTAHEDGSLSASQRYVVHDRIIVGGGSLTNAQPTFQGNERVVSFTFDGLGARRFAEATREHVGEPLAIVLDNKVISAPVIREPILDGRGMISGNFTVQSASDLALLLRAGALPAPLTTLEERPSAPGSAPTRSGTANSLSGCRRARHCLHGAVLWALRAGRGCRLVL
jgi:preprotein translocase subunit SecD